MIKISGIKEEIYELMKTPKGITVKEIVKKLKQENPKINANQVNIYIARLKDPKKCGLITDKNIISKIHLDKTKGKKDYVYKVFDSEPVKEPVQDDKCTKLLKFMNDFFKDNVDYLMRDSKIIEFITSHEEFDTIEEVTASA